MNLEQNSRRAYLGHSPAFYSARKMGCTVLRLISSIPVFRPAEREAEAEAAL